MLITTFILFALAAILGLILISKIFQDKSTPKSVVYLHGIAAVVALLLLCILYLRSGDTILLTSMLVLVIAAIGGFLLFGKDYFGQQVPKWLAAVHAVLSVTGFVILLFAAFI